MHSAALAPNIIEGDLRVLLDPSEPATNANARRGDCGGFLGHGRPLVLNFWFREYCGNVKRIKTHPFLEARFNSFNHLARNPTHSRFPATGA